MFPELRPFRPDANPAVTLAHIHALAQTMPESADSAIRGPDDPAFDIATLGSARTYFGQFVDHDLTKDAQVQPGQFFGLTRRGVLLDPSGAPVHNFETFRFDLSSVYGGGPNNSPQLYAADERHLLVVPDNGNGVRDLPRLPTGQAVLVEGRNDENQIISQLHLAFLMFHNAIVDLGHTFAEASRLAIRYYQWAVLHDFLPGWVGQDVVGRILEGSIRRFYRPGDHLAPLTPLEWSVAAYRFGHSVVRDDYELNDTDSVHNIFDGTDNDLHGGRLLEAGRQIDWGDFEKPLQSAANTAAGNTQSPRKVDTHISNGLFMLPIGGQAGAEVSGLSSLAERNMIRGLFYGLPSGQDIARVMGVPVIDPEQAIDPSAVRGFESGTPAWFYMLKEAEIAGGDGWARWADGSSRTSSPVCSRSTRTASSIAGSGFSRSRPSRRPRARSGSPTCSSLPKLPLGRDGVGRAVPSRSTSPSAEPGGSNIPRRPPSSLLRYANAKRRRWQL